MLDQVSHGGYSVNARTLHFIWHNSSNRGSCHEEESMNHNIQRHEQQPTWINRLAQAGSKIVRRSQNSNEGPIYSVQYKCSTINNPKLKRRQWQQQQWPLRLLGFSSTTRERMNRQANLWKLNQSQRMLGPWRRRLRKRGQWP